MSHIRGRFGVNPTMRKFLDFNEFFVNNRTQLRDHRKNDPKNKFSHFGPFFSDKKGVLHICNSAHSDTYRNLKNTFTLGFIVCGIY